MQLFSFAHDPAVKAGCCNHRATVTYWMAETPETARKEIKEHTNDGRDPHGLCSMCMAELIANEEYEITRVAQ